MPRQPTSVSDGGTSTLHTAVLDVDSRMIQRAARLCKGQNITHGRWCTFLTLHHTLTKQRLSSSQSLGPYHWQPTHTFASSKYSGCRSFFMWHTPLRSRKLCAHGRTKFGAPSCAEGHAPGEGKEGAGAVRENRQRCMAVAAMRSMRAS